MEQELEKTYSPGENEDKIYQKWEKSGFFNPDNLNLSTNAPSYTIILPPPNITDKLHVGHASTLAIEDLLIRYHRLQGFRTLWLPGTDHAAIATQNAVEKKLLRERGQSRHDLGRDLFLKEIWSFLEVTQNTILHQTRKMGASLDWSRLAFTLDEPRQLAVKTMFKQMYEEGAIYRGERIVNWCPRCHSTLADDEVEHKEQAAKLYTFKYDKNFPISISTTRPETKLGDTAVAVNPKDTRYKKLIGQELKVNFVGQELKIKIIADRNVDSTFGTGALGVTPAHSMIDWQIAQDNDLEIIKVISEEGIIREGFGKYVGLKALEARELIVKELIAKGLMVKEEEISNNLSICYRCDTAIEPLPSKQWFVSVDKKLEKFNGKSLKEKAIEVVENEEINFIPDRFKKRYLDWMNDLHDWCISRQIWFGHQIPVWYKDDEIKVELEAPTEEGWTQDPDTLDTWFSSGMWVFSTLGWPNNSEDLAKFYPTQVLETGYEIITLWVSRMIMMSLFSLGKVPFEDVYLHGMILDKDGKKMAKSKGNGIDPLDMIQKFGSDAVRLSLLTGSTPGNDARFSEDKVEAKRNFVNKLWNVSRFILTSTEETVYSTSSMELPRLKTLADKWIVGELNSLIEKTASRLDKYEFSLAAEDLTDFTWNKLADWYLEIAKIEGNKGEILIYLLKNILKLWHPFIPFVTETIWESFNDSMLMVEKWPEESKDQKIISELDSAGHTILKIQTIIQKIREARSDNRIEPKNRSDVVVYAHKDFADIKDQIELIRNLKTSTNNIEIKEKGEKIDGAIFTTVGEIEIYLSVEINIDKERERLKKETTNLKKVIILQEEKLANPDFINRAPEQIVTTEKEKLENYKKELNKITSIIK